MKLTKFARRHGFLIQDWSDELELSERMRGMTMWAVFADDNDCEPAFLATLEEDEDLYRIRNLWSDLEDGRMMSLMEIRSWIRNAGTDQPVYPLVFKTPEGRAVRPSHLGLAMRTIRSNPEGNYPGWNWFPTQGYMIQSEVRRGIHDRINRRAQEKPL